MLQNRAIQKFSPWFVLLLVGGLGLVFHPVFRSGFDIIPGDTGDSRLVNWILEHGFRWLRGDSLHREFWNPPFFYPARNIAAYTDIMLGAGPIYWLLRTLGLAPETAFQNWEIISSALNFGAMYWLLRRFNFRSAPSAIGAFLFAFGNARTSQLNHPQLISQYFSPIAIGCLIESFRATGQKKRTYWLALSAFSVTLQLYASFYLGWFLIFVGTIALVVAVTLKELRKALLTWLGSMKIEIVLIGAATAALLWPMLSHYLAASHELGPRLFSEVATMLPRIKSWFYLGSDNFLYGSLASWHKFARLPNNCEHTIGLGLLTFAACIAGLFLNRRDPVARISWKVLSIAILLTVFVGGYTLWRGVYEVFPGAKAARAVTRIQLVLLIPWAIGLASLVQKKPKWAITLLALVALEQFAIYPGYSKPLAIARSQAIANRIPTDCTHFLVAPVNPMKSGAEQLIDAMWAVFQTQKPTLNGYSGSNPPGWSLYTLESSQVRPALVAWKKSSGFEPDPKCILTAE